MPTDLYDILHVDRDATQEQIRKAYKKRALQTHPDRLSPGASTSDKASAEEQFRKVNNAYEVLSDPQNRRVYDLHGVWPPPQPGQAPNTSAKYGSNRKSHRSSTHPPPEPFQDPAFDSFFSRPFVFSDPNDIFDSFFGRRDNSRDNNHHQSHLSARPFGAFSRIDEFMHSMERNMFADMGGGFPRFSPPPPGPGAKSWMQQSVSRSINGVQQSYTETVDWDGNKHVTRIYPDGRKVHTINGVEQNDQAYLPSNAGPRSQGYNNQYLPPPPTSGHEAHFGGSSASGELDRSYNSSSGSGRSSRKSRAHPDAREFSNTRSSSCSSYVSGPPRSQTYEPPRSQVYEPIRYEEPSDRTHYIPEPVDSRRHRPKSSKTWW